MRRCEASILCCCLDLYSSSPLFAVAVDMVAANRPGRRDAGLWGKEGKWCKTWQVVDCAKGLSRMLVLATEYCVARHKAYTVRREGRVVEGRLR